MSCRNQRPLLLDDAPGFRLALRRVGLYHLGIRPREHRGNGARPGGATNQAIVGRDRLLGLLKENRLLTHVRRLPGSCGKINSCNSMQFESVRLVILE